jgi:putative PEP-CTERM system histidine kinase
VATAIGAAAVNFFFFLPFAAGFFSLLLGVFSLIRRRQSPAAWCFFAGMAALGLDSVFTGLNLRATQLGEVTKWLTAALALKSLVPVIWLSFSLMYSRSNYREFLISWAVPLGFLGLLPIGVALGLVQQLRSPAIPDDLWWLRPGVAATTLNVILLVALVLILANLEQTFRSAVGTMRWRIKFAVVALAVIFGARLYVRSQAILFSAPDIALWSIESGALFIGCLLLTLNYARTGLAEIDVYPSTTVVRSSLTVLIVGGYLFIVGVLAQLVSHFGGAEIFQYQAVIVLLGMAGLAVLLLSDRARQRIHVFVARHFGKAQHDSARIWKLLSLRLASVTDQTRLCMVSAKLISETFDVLSVTVWLLDEEKGGLVIGASTARQKSDASGASSDTTSSAVIAGLQSRSSPLDLEDVHEAWAEELRQLNKTTFPNGGNRLCVPLRAGEQTLGVLVLADRVSSAIYTVEELELLKCIGDQMTSVLLNLRLATEVARARELEAFRTMSAFFVHDLKNAAASLNLMLKNLPVHFDDPAFREDALRGVGNTARRIDEMIARLSALRHRPDSVRVDADLNQLVNEALDRLNGMPNVEVMRELQPLPGILADREQIQSVVTNLVLNARDALGSGGRIQVHTEHKGERVVLSVVDNGCGMTQAYVKESLFRPFQSTKKKGLGIGLFQSRAIVQAHGGGVHVESEPGKGTTFLVSFPISGEK